MLPCSPSENDHHNHSFDPMKIMPFLEELEAEQIKLLVHITNNEQRITALEAKLESLQSLPGYQPQFSLADNLKMVFGMLNNSIAMAHAVFAAQDLSAAHASAACYLASLGIACRDSSPDTADDCANQQA